MYFKVIICLLSCLWCCCYQTMNTTCKFDCESNFGFPVIFSFSSDYFVFQWLFNMWYLSIPSLSVGSWVKQVILIVLIVLFHQVFQLFPPLHGTNVSSKSSGTRFICNSKTNLLLYTVWYTSLTSKSTLLLKSLRVREVPGSIPSQGPRHTKDVIKMVPVVPLFSTQLWKGKYWLFLKN